MTPESVRAALEAAPDVPRDTLPHAVEHAAVLAPAIIDVVNLAARGVELRPPQGRLLFWGAPSLVPKNNFS